VAATLRLVAFGQVPPGLYHDEAHNGLDALDILRGHFPLYFPANNGREPLFIYLIALAVGVLGKSPFALRLVAFFAGTLTVAATAAMGRALFSRRVGLLAAAVLAVTLWHVHLSRVGFRAVLLPLFIALAAWQGASGVRKTRGQGDKRQEAGGKKQEARSRKQEAGSKKQEARGKKQEAEGGEQEAGDREGKWEGWYHWLAAGVFYGLSFYTYTAVRFTPIALAAFGIYGLATQSAIRHSPFGPPWAGLCLRPGDQRR
jgi:4-amino-4-deoxy-L-arabinose transferase-like glycosyltransferase